MQVRVIKTESPFTFRWPVGLETYDLLEEVSVDGIAGRAGRLSLAYGFRDAYGRKRRRILVFRDAATVLVEFFGTDDWERTREVATVLRQAGSRRHLRPTDAIPTAYRALTAKPARRLLSGPFVPNALVAVVDESDRAGLIEVALAREQVRYTVVPAVLA